MLNWGPLLRHPIPQRYGSCGKQPLPQLSLWISMLFLRTPRPITPGWTIIYWNLQWEICTGMGELLGIPGELELLRLHCDPVGMLQTKPVEMHYLEWNTHYRKRGESGGLGLGLPILNPCPHTWQCCLPSNMYCMHNQVKFLKLPTFLFSRPVGHILFPTGMFIWPPSLFPPLAWKMSQHTIYPVNLKL